MVKHCIKLVLSQNAIVFSFSQFISCFSATQCCALSTLSQPLSWACLTSSRRTAKVNTNSGDKSRTRRKEDNRASSRQISHRKNNSNRSSKAKRPLLQVDRPPLAWDHPLCTTHPRLMHQQLKPMERQPLLEQPLATLTRVPPAVCSPLTWSVSWPRPTWSPPVR